MRNDNDNGQLDELLMELNTSTGAPALDQSGTKLCSSKNQDLYYFLFTVLMLPASGLMLYRDIPSKHNLLQSELNVCKGNNFLTGLNIFFHFMIKKPTNYHSSSE